MLFNEDYCVPYSCFKAILNNSQYLTLDEITLSNCLIKLECENKNEDTISSILTHDQLRNCILLYEGDIDPIVENYQSHKDSNYINISEFIEKNLGINTSKFLFDFNQEKELRNILNLYHSKIKIMISSDYYFTQCYKITNQFAELINECIHEIYLNKRKTAFKLSEEQFK